MTVLVQCSHTPVPVSVAPVLSLLVLALGSHAHTVPVPVIPRLPQQLYLGCEVSSRALLELYELELDEELHGSRCGSRCVAMLPRPKFSRGCVAKLWKSKRRWKPNSKAEFAKDAILQF